MTPGVFLVHLRIIRSAQRELQQRGLRFRQPHTLLGRLAQREQMAIALDQFRRQHAERAIGKLDIAMTLLDRLANRRERDIKIAVADHRLHVEPVDAGGNHQAHLRLIPVHSRTLERLLTVDFEAGGLQLRHRTQQEVDRRDIPAQGEAVAVALQAVLAHGAPCCLFLLPHAGGWSAAPRAAHHIAWPSPANRDPAALRSPS